MTSAAEEQRLIAEFFGERTGYFVEVGANEPRLRSQTFHLEQKGWTGVLVEPQPDLAERSERRALRFVPLVLLSPGGTPRTTYGALSQFKGSLVRCARPRVGFHSGQRRNRGRRAARDCGAE